MTAHAPNLVLIVGPPAVGKMTVGAALARRTGMRLFHNHQTIDLILPFFEFGTPPFVRLVGEFRQRIFEEVASSELPGMIFTYVRAFADPADEKTIEAFVAPFRARGGRVLFAELEASLPVRLARNETPLRLEAKPSKRDVVASRRRLLDMERYQMNSGGRFDGQTDYLRVDNSDMSPDDVADRIVAYFGLAVVY